MGIPRLISTLEPYAEHGLLQDERVVIDGPALAYHILYVCNRDGLIQPSYQVLGATAIAWLDELVDGGVDIKAIFFDGHLPSTKLATRMERTRKSFSQLKTFHNSNAKGCSWAYLGRTEGKIPELFKHGAPSGKQFLPPSFHVPAVIDALKSSRYRPLVQLVPGEADAFCAQQLLQHGGTVITSDSDLLVHDLGNGQVVFFRDIYLDGSSKLTCAGFRPGRICTRIGLSSSADSCRLAYERKTSPHSTLPQIVRACEGQIVDEAGYSSFCKEYLDNEVAPLPRSAHGQTLVIDCLDPRLSELILQLGYQSGDPLGDQVKKMFLPILIENPTQGSAWEQSTPIRQLAYTVARWIIRGESSSIQEYRRVNTVTQKGREVRLLPKEHANEFIAELLDLIKKLSVRADSEPENFWYLLCLVLDIRGCFEVDKKSHALQILQQSANNPPSAGIGNVSWELIHFNAHLQASFYSFRMLSQILSLECDDPKLRNIHQLRTALAGLPGFSHFPDINSVSAYLKKTKELGTLRLITRLVPIPESTTQPQPAGSSKRKRAKKSTYSTKTGVALASAAPRNLYDLLLDQQ